MKPLLASIIDHVGNAKRTIAIVGSGGKTTLMIALAAAYAKRGERVLLSTTTKLQKPDRVSYGCDRSFTDDAIFRTVHHPGQRIFYALDGKEKALAPPIEHLASLSKRFSVTLIEADGARGMDLKIHSERDPVIPSFTTATIATLSLSALGKSAASVCFGCDGDQSIVDEAWLEAYIRSPAGPMKAMRGTPLLLCTQSEHVDRNSIQNLRDRCADLPILFGSLHSDTVVAFKGLVL
ncbi:MAG: selenium cofactor biosynthesis protein YqeC [Sphaerochaeta sp.]|nr:selenium cofactor biosynthesis protein YqeC [Sphaerochaeta sp.]